MAATLPVGIGWRAVGDSLAVPLHHQSEMRVEPGEVIGDL
jgi:hypothetical protein